MKRTHPSPFRERRIRILVNSQVLEIVEHGVVTRRYPVSTSKFGEGFAEGSFQTPTGCFQICEKIGGGAPVGMQFRSRVPTGCVVPQGGDEDLILTRILWLDGLDPENANTRDRFIYIHGTNQEAQIGIPASHGCVRMKAADLLELYDLVEQGTRVEIIK